MREQSQAPTTLSSIIMAVYKHWLIVILLIVFHAAYDVYASHFRGAVIMVRPKPGGAVKEVLKIIFYLLT